MIWIGSAGIRTMKSCKKTFLNLDIYDFNGLFGVLKSDIEKLDCYEDWKKFSMCSAMAVVEVNGKKENLVYIHDWERFYYHCYLGR